MPVNFQARPAALVMIRSRKDNLNRSRKAREEEYCFACGANARVLNLLIFMLARRTRRTSLLILPSVQTLHLRYGYAGLGGGIGCGSGSASKTGTGVGSGIDTSGGTRG
jgi:hypothetical protein